MEKIAIIGVMAVLLAIPLRKEKQELSMLVILAGCLLIIGYAIYKLEDIFQLLNRVSEDMGESRIYIKILLKMVGITYVAEFGSNLCRDAGSSAVAAQIEFYGKLMLLSVSMPIWMTLLDTLESFQI